MEADSAFYHERPKKYQGTTKKHKMDALTLEKQGNNCLEKSETILKQKYCYISILCGLFCAAEEVHMMLPF